MNATDPELDGTGLRALLVAGSDDLPPDIDLLRGVRDRRRRRARRRTRALVPGGAVAAGGAAALAALLATSVSTAPSALAAVTSAVAKTSAESYRFSLSSTTAFRHRVLWSAVVTGAFDPRHNRGTEALRSRIELVQGRLPVRRFIRAQIRFIGGYVYTRVSPGAASRSPGKPWDKAPIPPPWDNPPRPGVGVIPGEAFEGYSFERPVSPAVLLRILRSEATVHVVGPASGPGWTGTRYAFTARVKNAVDTIVTGTVYVDQQGRVRRLVTATRIGIWTNRGSDPLTTTNVLTFGDFRTPVPVSPPPAGQVAYTTTPYWVFGS